jgi:hypothetical protein
MLRGKSAVVTGSTSGIGLTVATALAETGTNVLLNGFGDKAEIEATRNGLAAKYGVRGLSRRCSKRRKPSSSSAITSQAWSSKQSQICSIMTRRPVRIKLWDDPRAAVACMREGDT